MIKKLKAITLTETVVYIAIFSIFMLTLMQFFISIQINQDRVYKELELEMNRIFLTNHLEERVKDNFTLDLENSVINNDNGIAILTSNHEVLIYKILNGSIVLETEHGMTSLTNNKAVVEVFNIEKIQGNTNTASAIKIHIKFKHRDEDKVQYDFTTLVKLIENEN